MSRRHVLAVLLGLIALTIPTIVALAVGQAGRQQNVQESRNACLRTVPRNAAAINDIRAEAIGDLAVATDPKQSVRTRDARRLQVAKENIYAEVLDSQTDRSAWRRLDYKVDQHAVRYGIDGHPPFQCATAFPPARFLP